MIINYFMKLRKQSTVSDHQLSINWHMILEVTYNTYAYNTGSDIQHERI